MISEETLLRHIPNYVAAGYKEKSLLDKLLPSVSLAEAWAAAYISTDDIISQSRELCEIRDSAVALRTLYIAAPLLDVTMHPNGLAVVNTDSLAPASRERSLEFRKAIESHLLETTDKFLKIIFYPSDHESEDTELGKIHQRWLISYPAISLWLRTVFDSCESLCTSLGIDRSFDTIRYAITSLTPLEHEIGERWISIYLLNILRQKGYPEDHGQQFQQLAMLVRSALAEAYKTKSRTNSETMRAIVQYIRENPAAFPQWFDSKTAELFLDPPRFLNQKKSGGYFF